MKKKKWMIFVAILIVLSGILCFLIPKGSNETNEPEGKKLVGTIERFGPTLVTVIPYEAEEELLAYDKIYIKREGLEEIGAVAGSMVEIIYSGMVDGNLSSEIAAISWKLAGDLRHLEYTEEWIDKSTALKHEDWLVGDVIITRIYSNCFFARHINPTATEIKVNGVLSEEWCPGDKVYCTCENTYYEEKSNRIEADALSIEASNWQPDPMLNAKPVIYLYPEETMKATIKLEYNGKLTCTYPAYQNGWTVTASPDGTLTDEKGQIYNYLYWEGEAYTQYDLSKGFCVKGEDTAAFLEETLAKLGLTRREANEFIVYWLPLMEVNPYNIISFQTDVYTDSAKLLVDPEPDTLIRVFMAWQEADEYIEIPEQELTFVEREGFTVVEWGGTKI